MGEGAKIAALAAALYHFIKESGSPKAGPTRVMRPKIRPRGSEVRGLWRLSSLLELVR